MGFGIGSASKWASRKASVGRLGAVDGGSDGCVVSVETPVGSLLGIDVGCLEVGDSDGFVGMTGASVGFFEAFVVAAVGEYDGLLDGFGVELLVTVGDSVGIFDEDGARVEEVGFIEG